MSEYFQYVMLLHVVKAVFGAQSVAAVDIVYKKLCTINQGDAIHSRYFYKMYF